jgi:hypothetical protein
MLISLDIQGKALLINVRCKICEPLYTRATKSSFFVNTNRIIWRWTFWGLEIEDFNFEVWSSSAYLTF